MKNIILGMVAAFALCSFGVARAEDAPAGDAPKAEKKEKKAKKAKKAEKTEEPAAGGDKK